MSRFSVNPHTLRTAAHQFSAAAAGMDHALARFQGQAGVAAGAVGDLNAEATYERLHADHLTALRNLRDSLNRVAGELLQVAAGYERADHEFVVSGDQQR